MLQLNKLTDYAIHIILLMALHHSKVNVAEISDTLRIPANSVRRIMQILKSNNLVCSELGVEGGYILARPPSQISIANVIHAMGQKTTIMGCIESDRCSSRYNVENCPVRSVLSKAQKEIDEIFVVTFADLIIMQ